MNGAVTDFPVSAHCSFKFASIFVSPLWHRFRFDMRLLPWIILPSVVLYGRTATAESDLIKSLPGLSYIPKFEQYSGYLNASSTRFLHYSYRLSITLRWLIVFASGSESRKRMLPEILSSFGESPTHSSFSCRHLSPMLPIAHFRFQGGPGYSSLRALLKESGPFLVMPDGKSLQNNPHSWNRVSSAPKANRPSTQSLHKHRGYLL